MTIKRTIRRLLVAYMVVALAFATLIFRRKEF